MQQSYITKALSKAIGLKTQNLAVFSLLSVLIALGFAAVEMLLYWLSLNYVVYEGWVSWYFPVGLRVVTFLMLPFRYWPALMLANGLGQACFNYLYYDQLLSQVEYIQKVLINPWLNQALPLMGIVIVKIKGFGKQIDQFRPMLMIVGACLFYRLARSAYLISSSTWLYTDIPSERFFEMTVAHILGGFVGIFVVAITAYLGVWVFNQRKNVNLTKVTNFVVQIGILIQIVFAIYVIQPEVVYLMRMLAIIPIVWFAYQFGWPGAMGGALVFNGFVLLMLFGINDSQAMLENQAFVITYSIMALMLGALFNEQKLAAQSIDEKNQQLKTSNQSLLQLSRKIQALSSTLVDVQERDRKSLSQELHDEIGQNLTALKTTLKVLEKKLEDGQLSAEMLAKANRNADHIYGSIYDLMHWLRPRDLDELGLVKVLEGHYFRDRLNDAGIAYEAEVNGDVSTLSDNHLIAVFRICQEAVTNTIKHSGADSMEIHLQVGYQVDLTINDNGIWPKALGSSSPTSFGLLGIEERVLALGGKFSIGNNQGTKLSVQLPIEQGQQDSSEVSQMS